MRSLKVRCATWDHVETFYRRKLRRGNILSIRVPFCPQQGAQITLGLELPDETTLAIDGTVIGVKPSPDGKRATIHLSLYGMTRDVLGRLEAQVAESRGEAVEAAADDPSGGRTVVPPAPLPADAPIDERIEVRAPPEPVALGEYERGVFDTLESELARMRSAAAHEVLGVPPNAGIATVRDAYFELARRFHPDTYARYRSAAVSQMAEELFVFINTAYDRLRRALAADGATVIGPAMLPQDGWLVGLDDIEFARPEPAVREPDSDEVSEPYAAVEMGDVADSGVHAENERAALAALAADDPDSARAALAEALHVDPRNRRLRALYHVATGRTAQRNGRQRAAIANYEAALAHDASCAEARADLDALSRDQGAETTGQFRRRFR